MDNCHILDIKTYDIANGPGIRTSVWVAGCAHHCEGCHNPETWKWNQGRSLTYPLMNQIIQSCDKPYIEGLTLTGGDPLFPKNIKGVTELCKRFRCYFGEGKTIWMWTGYSFEQVKDLEIFRYIDYVVDGKYIKEQKDSSLIYAGSRNQRVIRIHTNGEPLSIL